MNYVNSLLLMFIFVQIGMTARILGVFFAPLVSHLQVFMPIMKDLASRGHNVTIIRPNISNESSLENVNIIDFSASCYDKFAPEVPRVMAKNSFLLSKVSFYLSTGQVVVEALLQTQSVQELLKSSAEFDLIILQVLHPLIFSVAAKCKTPVVGEYSLCS